MSKPITPEEKLLHLIEDGEAGKLPKSGLWTTRFWSDVLTRTLTRTAGVSRALRKTVPREMTLGLVNRCLAVLFVGLVGGIAYNFTREEPTLVALLASIEGGTAHAAGEKPSEGSPAEPPSDVKLLAEYRDQIGSRDIFQPYVEPPKIVEPPPPPQPVEPTKLEILEGKKANLKLQGFLRSDPPKALIKDTSTEEMRSVKQGDTLGDLRVKSISRDSVTLEYDSAESELFYE